METKSPTEQNYAQYAGAGIGAIGTVVGIYKTNKALKPAREFYSTAEEFCKDSKDVFQSVAQISAVDNKKGLSEIATVLTDAQKQDAFIKSAIDQPHIENLNKIAKENNLSSSIDAALVGAKKSISKLSTAGILFSIALIPAGFGIGVLVDRAIKHFKNKEQTPNV